MIVYLFTYPTNTNYYLSPDIKTVMEYFNIGPNLDWVIQIVKINTIINEFEIVSEEKLLKLCSTT